MSGPAPLHERNLHDERERQEAMGPTEKNRQSPLSPPRAHESIWKRSKKILGLNSFEFLQESHADDPESTYAMPLS
jgi:hypothetical protein